MIPGIFHRLMRSVLVPAGVASTATTGAVNAESPRCDEDEHKRSTENRDTGRGLPQETPIPPSLSNFT